MSASSSNPPKPSPPIYATLSIASVDDPSLEVEALFDPRDIKFEDPDWLPYDPMDSRPADPSGVDDAPKQVDEHERLTVRYMSSEPDHES